jgi:hypothetical protein
MLIGKNFALEPLACPLKGMKISARSKDAKQQRRNRELKELEDLEERVEKFVYGCVIVR